MKNDHNNEQSIGDKEASQQHETNSKTDGKHQDAKKTKEVKVVKETQEKDTAPEDQKSTATRDVDETETDDKQSKLHSYAQSLKSLCCRIKANFLKLPRKKQVGFIAGIVIAFFIVIVLLSLIGAMSSGSSEPAHAHQYKTSSQSRVAISDGNNTNSDTWNIANKKVSNSTAQTMNSTDTSPLALEKLEHLQKNMLDTQKIILSRLDTLSRQLAAIASNDQNEALKAQLKSLQSANGNITSQVGILNHSIDNLSSKVTAMTQVFASHNSEHVSLIDNPGFKLSSIMWLNNQPKAVVYTDHNKGDQMLAIGDTIDQWTLANIHGNCTIFTSSKGENKQCV